MNVYANSHLVKPDLPRQGAAPALAVYMAALSAYQQRRTVEGKDALFQSYRRWIGAFLDDDAEADRATANFLVALRNQPSQSAGMDGRGMNAISPLRHVRDGGWRHIGGVAGGVVRRSGLRAIRVHLDRAAGSSGCEAAASIREADGIRQQLGLSWDQVVAGGGAVV